MATACYHPLNALREIGGWAREGPRAYRWCFSASATRRASVEPSARATRSATSRLALRSQGSNSGAREGSSARRPTTPDTPPQLSSEEVIEPTVKGPAELLQGLERHVLTPDLETVERRLTDP